MPTIRNTTGDPTLGTKTTHRLYTSQLPKTPTEHSHFIDNTAQRQLPDKLPTMAKNPVTADLQ